LKHAWMTRSCSQFWSRLAATSRDLFISSSPNSACDHWAGIATPGGRHRFRLIHRKVLSTLPTDPKPREYVGCSDSTLHSLTITSVIRTATPHRQPAHDVTFDNRQRGRPQRRDTAPLEPTSRSAAAMAGSSSCHERRSPKSVDLSKLPLIADQP